MRYKREQILSMQDTELNMLAGKDVMEWEYDAGIWFKSVDGVRVSQAGMTMSGNGNWSPSTNISDALQLIEQFVDVDLRKSVNYDHEHIYTVKIGREFFITNKREEWPKIITQAAILAMMEGRQ